MKVTKRLKRYRKARLEASAHGPRYFLEWIKENPAPKGFKLRTIQRGVVPLCTAMAAPITGSWGANGVLAHPARSNPSKSKPSKSRDSRLPPAGTILTKSFKGREYRVEVLDRGVRCDGKDYRSLSGLATSIAQLKAVNGFVWFGLLQPWTEQPSPPAPKRKRVEIR